MESSKSQIHAKFYKIPMIRFEDQQSTSFSGLLAFQMLFKRLKLKVCLPAHRDPRPRIHWRARRPRASIPRSTASAKGAPQPMRI